MEQIEAKIEELKRRAEQRETIRYPKDFKEDAVEAVDRLRTKGWTQTAISEALGIPWVTLKRWRVLRCGPNDSACCMMSGSVA